MELFKLLCIVIAILLGTIIYIINSDTYLTDQLDHLDDRILFGRLQCKVKANIQVGKVSVVNNKILYVKYKGEQVFKAENEPFLKLMKAEGEIVGNSDSFYQISDQIQKICKLQHVESIRQDTDRQAVIIQGNFIDCENSNYSVELINQKSNDSLKINVKVPKQYQRVYLIFNHSKEQEYYGLGQQFSYLNLGHDRPYSTYVREKGVGRTQQPLTWLANMRHGAGGSYFTSYAPMPIWFNSKRMGYILNDYSYMAWINNKMLVWSNEFQVLVFKEQNYKDVVKRISEFNGYSKKIPSWVNSGAIVGIQGGSTKVKEKYHALKQAGANIAGLWIQDWVAKRSSYGYSRLWWNWELDQDYYHDWLKMQSNLEKQNVNLLIYVNPMLTQAVQKQNYRNNYYKEAIDNGYFIKNKDQKVFNISAVSNFFASLIDFENPKAVEFFKRIISQALQETNAKGMMIDFSQGFPAQQIPGSIQHGARKHNEYPTKYHQKTSEIIQQLQGKNNDFYVFTRAGYLKSPKYAHSLWAGDQAMNFNFHTGLPSCLTAILSSGLVGYSTTHCDIGGYTHISNILGEFSKRTQILMIRWMQLSAFTSVFRSHEGNSPDITIQIYSNPYMLSNFAFYSRVFAALAEYRDWQYDLSKTEGIPLVRALFLQLDGMKGTEDIQDQFYLGSDILVAPYLQSKPERMVFVPKGQWRSIWDGKIVKGCDCQRVFRSQMFPPVLIKSSSRFKGQVLTTIDQLVEQYKLKIAEPDRNQDL